MFPSRVKYLELVYFCWEKIYLTCFEIAIMSSIRLPRQTQSCDHELLRFITSAHADKVGFRRLTDQQRANAAGKKKSDYAESEVVFPAPLVLPGDELCFDPSHPPQSLHSWIRLRERNEVTRRRNVLYVAHPPQVGADVEFIRGWSSPHEVKNAYMSRPQLADLSDYLAAFYHGVKVKVLPPESLRFAKWDRGSSGRSKAGPCFVGLSTLQETVRIRVRTSSDGVFSGQLNLEDLLDTVMGMLPDDAYALLLLIEHDLYEDEDDDFCCGRAYGGSRVAVVSMARYNPVLDSSQNVDRQHAWPASHCENYVYSCCEELGRKSKSLKNSARHVSAITPLVSHGTSLPTDITAMQAAVNAHKQIAEPDLSGLWLSRVCQTASHELGHCFGMDHCVYYACVMQSTSSLAEDVRQPPYLCPVDLAKILRATNADEKERYDALFAFCMDHPYVPTFAAYGAWIENYTKRLEPKPGSEDKPIEL